MTTVFDLCYSQTYWQIFEQKKNIYNLRRKIDKIQRDFNMNSCQRNQRKTTHKINEQLII